MVISNWKINLWSPWNRFIHQYFRVARVNTTPQYSPISHTAGTRQPHPAHYCQNGSPNDGTASIQRPRRWPDVDPALYHDPDSAMLGSWQCPNPGQCDPDDMWGVDNVVLDPVTVVPVTSGREHNTCSVSAQRLSRWPIIEPTPGQR